MVPSPARRLPRSPPVPASYTTTPVHSSLSEVLAKQRGDLHELVEQWALRQEIVLTQAYHQSGGFQPMTTSTASGSEESSHACENGHSIDRTVVLDANRHKRERASEQSIRDRVQQTQRSATSLESEVVECSTKAATSPPPKSHSVKFPALPESQPPSPRRDPEPSLRKIDEAAPPGSPLLTLPASLISGLGLIEPQGGTERFGLSVDGLQHALDTVNMTEQFHAGHNMWEYLTNEMMVASNNMEIIASRYRAIMYVEIIVKSAVFEMFCTVFIVANAILLGIITDFNSKYGHNGGFEAAVIPFGIFFIIELTMRVLGFRMLFFFGPEWMWNWFDAMLVGTTVWELLTIIGVFGYNYHNLSYARMVRVAKMAKLLRVMKVLHQFRELRLMLASVLGSARSFGWCTLLLASVTYVFSNFFVQATTELRMVDDRFVVDLVDLPESIQVAAKHFGSLPDGMLSLLAAVSGGTDWLPLAEAVREAGPQYYFLFVLYIMFFLFVVLTTATSLFVDSMSQMSESDEYHIEQEHLQRRDGYRNQILRLFQNVDKDHSGNITYEELRDHLKEPEMVKFATNLQIDVTDLELVFNILSANGQEPVNLETFVVGCIRLRGSAKSVDLIDLTLSHKKSVERQVRFERRFEAHLEILTRLQVSSISRPPSRPASAVFHSDSGSFRGSSSVSPVPAGLVPQGGQNDAASVDLDKSVHGSSSASPVPAGLALQGGPHDAAGVDLDKSSTGVSVNAVLPKSSWSGRSNPDTRL